MRFSAAEIAQATGGRLAGADVDCDSVSIDTRTIETDALFVPIVAERDGHDFIAAAVQAGAAAYLTEREPQDVSAAAIVVEDTTRALADLGRAARSRFDGPVIAITGSVGKTSVKDLAAAAIGSQRRVHASAQSFNNELGVPLTLCNSPIDTQVLVVEMGARGIGHIGDLCEIARPTVGIVTWVGAVHTSEFGSIEAVAQAKGELIEALPVDGVAILNADNEFVAAMSALTEARVVRYGATDDIHAESISLDADLRPRFELVDGDARLPVQLAVRGLHQVTNAVAAVAAARTVDVSLADAIDGLTSAVLSPWRMELAHTPAGAAVINDAYNANAISTEAALRSLAYLDAERRIAVLGVMAELGDRHDADHRAMTELCDELGIELIAFGEPAYGRPVASDFESVIAQLGSIGRGDAVLVKGSRVAGLEELAALLVAE